MFLYFSIYHRECSLDVSFSFLAVAFYEAFIFNDLFLYLHDGSIIYADGKPKAMIFFESCPRSQRQASPGVSALKRGVEPIKVTRLSRTAPPNCRTRRHRREVKFMSFGGAARAVSIAEFFPNPIRAGMARAGFHDMQGNLVPFRPVLRRKITSFPEPCRLSKLEDLPNCANLMTLKTSSYLPSQGTTDNQHSPRSLIKVRSALIKSWFGFVEYHDEA